MGVIKCIPHLFISAGCWIRQPNIKFGPNSHAKAQNRTADTLIFSQVLYHLSYLGDLWIISGRTGLSSVKKILTLPSPFERERDWVRDDPCKT